VIQLGQKRRGLVSCEGTRLRLHPEHVGYSGFRPEARVSIEYKIRTVTVGDGTVVELHEPRYHVAGLDGPELQPNTVLMPRMPPLFKARDCWNWFRLRS